MTSPHPVVDLSTEMQGFISVDVETSGPNPSEHSILSIGACTLLAPRQTFYAELQPLNENFSHEALSISHLSMPELAMNGLPPADAMERFELWLKHTLPQGVRPIFVAFNAPYDWSFINDYFHRFLGHNPFGHNAIDIKAYYMGRRNLTWEQTSLRYVSQRYLGDHRLSHNALHDAMDQADLFLKIMEDNT
jgi:DNA polymerase III epsilon subunit-like protein